jgi:regulator of RNase E activity RraA
MTDTIAALAAFDTPTICNALDLLRPDRKGVSFTQRTMICAFPDRPPLVGYAATARMRSRTPAGRTPEETAAARRGYYAYVAASRVPAVMAIQDLDQPTGFGGIWGDVNAAIHLGLGVQGVITDGAFRDWPVLPPGFQILAAAVTPSHGNGHVVDWDVPVEILGMQVNPGDLLHADRHGAVVVPADLAPRLAEAAGLVQRRERLLLDAARAPGFDVDRLMAAFADAAKLR